MNTNIKTARLAGFLYLLYIVTTALANLIGRSKLIVDGDAAATARNILAHEWQFRFGFVSDTLAAVLFLLTAWALYVLLKPINHDFALLLVLLNLAGVVIQCFSLLNLFAALTLLSGADYLKTFQANQLHAQAMFFLDLHTNGFTGAQLFFGAWLFPLGYLVFKSGFLPRVLGILLIMDGFAVLIWFFQFFLFPDYDTITYLCWAVGFIAEVSLTLWLLIKGVKDQKPVLIEATLPIG